MVVSFLNYSAGVWGDPNYSVPATTLLAATLTATVTARALHARLLETAAARRRRAADRISAERRDDALFWLTAAPAALAKAAALRDHSGLARLP